MEFYGDASKCDRKVSDCIFQSMENTQNPLNALDSDRFDNIQPYDSSSSFSYIDSYSVQQPLAMRLSQSVSLPFIPITEHSSTRMEAQPCFTNGGFTVKQGSWDKSHDAALSPHVPDISKLYFNSPYNSPKTGSDQSSVHSPSECIISPCTGPPLVTCIDQIPSPTYSESGRTTSSPNTVNSYVVTEKRGKRGRPRGSKNKSTLAKALDSTVFPAGSLFPGKRRGRGTRTRGANPGIRARVNYRSSPGEYSLGPQQFEHESKRGSSTRGRGAMRMCKICVNCLRTDDCAECVFCKDKSKFGGSNKLKQKCLKKQCVYKGKFVEHDTTATESRYIVQKKCPPPPLSHPPFHDTPCSSTSFDPVTYPDDQPPFISTKEYMVECATTPLGHHPEPMMGYDPSFPVFTESPSTEFLQNLPVKVWLSADPGVCQD